MSSETQRASSDGNAVQGDHEAAVMDNNYPSSNATLIWDQLIRDYERDVAIFTVILFIAIFAAVLIIRIRANEPVYVPPLTFKVVSLEVASMTISNNPSYVSADLNLTLSLTNKEDQQLLIEPLVVSIMYDDEFLSSKKIDPLYLSGQNHNHKSIELDMGITASQLNVATVDSISTDLAINHSLVFKILIRGRYSILISGDIDDQYIYGVAITCDRVKVNFLSVKSNLTAGSLINGPCSCKHINVV